MFCTVVTRARIEGVEQSPIEGASFASVLRDPDAAPTRATKYFEMLGSRAIYHDGWKAVTFKPLARLYDDGIDPDAPFSEDRWELYHVAEDFSESHDVADQHPERLAELIDLWWQEARAHQVLPLDNRPLAATRARLPARVLDLLALYCLAAAGMLGYTVAAAGGRHRPAAYAMFVLLAFAFATIHDLDRPRSGAILVDQSILADTVRRL